MSLNGSRPAITKVALKSKRIGVDEHREHRVGTHCRTERSGACLGEFIIWFPGHRFVKVDANKLLDVVQHTDNKPQL